MTPRVSKYVPFNKLDKYGSAPGSMQYVYPPISENSAVVRLREARPHPGLLMTPDDDPNLGAYSRSNPLAGRTFDRVPLDKGELAMLRRYAPQKRVRAPGYSRESVGAPISGPDLVGVTPLSRYSIDDPYNLVDVIPPYMT